MINFDEFGFNWPKKVFWFLVVVLIIISSVIGVVKQSSEEGIKFYFMGIETITKPVLNRLQNRAERFVEKALSGLKTEEGFNSGK